MLTNRLCNFLVLRSRDPYLLSISDFVTPSYTSTMLKFPVMHHFSVGDFRRKLNDLDHEKIQLILYYAESRFARILNSLKSADDNQQWRLKLLHRELASPVYNKYYNLFL